MRHTSIYIKGMILVIIPLFSQIVFLGSLVKIRADHRDTQAWALHATRVVADADALSASFAETHSALRGYLITHDGELSEQYRAYQTRTADELRSLGKLVADNPQQTERVQLIEERAFALATWFDKLHGLIATGRYAEAAQAARDQRGQLLIDSVRTAIGGFLQAEERLSAERQQRLQRQATVQDLVLFGGGALALLSTALLGYLFARSIAARLKALAENTRRVAAGKELLAPLAGDDEIGQLDRVFRDMAAALEQKNQENEMFVYSVSHDLRSPLVNLQGFSQELAASCNDLRGLLVDAEDVPAPTRQRARVLLDRNMADSVRFIQTAVSRLSGIIDALLRLSRAGRVEYRWQIVDVEAAVRRSVDALRATLDQRQADVVIGSLPPVWGDPTALEQVFANLIGNAANYLDPKRPGRIEVGRLSADVPGPATSETFFVRDNGVGIPEAQQAKVFLAFQRLHPELARGEGIGLALVRRVVERHGGRIWLESTAGVGTTFFVMLPAVAASRQPTPGPAAGRLSGKVMVPS